MVTPSNPDMAPAEEAKHVESAFRLIAGPFAAFLGRRAALGLSILLAVVSIMFLLQVVLVRGDFATTYRLSADEQTVAMIRDQMGLNDPLVLRYASWLWRLVQLDLGLSFSGTDISQTLALRTPYSLLIFLSAASLAYWVGISIGTRAGARGRTSDAFVSSISAAVASFFPAAIAFLVLFSLRGYLGFESFSALRRLGTPSTSDLQVYALHAGWSSLLYSMALVAFILGLRARRGPASWLGVGVGIGCGLLARRYGGYREFLDVIQLIAAPGLALALLLSADSVVLAVKRSRVEWAEPYVDAAFAKGLDLNQIRRRHIKSTVRPAMLARAVAMLPVSLSGVAIVESAFARQGELSLSVPGLGALIFGALTGRDIPLALGGMLAVGVIVVVLWLLLEAILWVVDPRLRERLDA